MQVLLHQVINEAEADLCAMGCGVHVTLADDAETAAIQLADILREAESQGLGGAVAVQPDVLAAAGDIARRTA